MKLYIKNMVCDRCILAVKHELEKLNINYLIEKLKLNSIFIHKSLDVFLNHKPQVYHVFASN